MLVHRPTKGNSMQQYEPAQKKLMLFSGTTNEPLAQAIAQELGLELGGITIHQFANSEIYVRYTETVRNADVFLVQSVAGDVNAALMELLIMADAAHRASCHSITAVITHYGYARQDKKSASREPITAKLVANLLTTAGVNRVITIDLHQGQIQGYFDIPVTHLSALSLLGQHFKDQNLENVCVVSPDVGRAKAAKKLADIIGADLAIMQKGRPEHNVAEIMEIIGHVEGKNCILNDDMIDTGGTILAGAKALKEAGALSVRISATHGVFSRNALDKFAAADIEELVVTDTIPVPESYVGDKIQVISVAPLIAKAIANMFEGKSVSTIHTDPDYI